MIVKLRELPGGVLLLQCPPQLTKTMQGSTALYDPDLKGWLLSASDMPSISGWLEAQGHVVMSPTPVRPEASWKPTGERLTADQVKAHAAKARKALRDAKTERETGTVPGEVTNVDLDKLIAQLQQVRPDWDDAAELRVVLVRLVQGHGITQTARLVARTLEVASAANTPWGLLAAGSSNPPAATAPQAPGLAHDDHPAAAAEPSADQAPAATQVDEPW